MQQVIIGSAWNILAISGARSNSSFLPTTPSGAGDSRGSRRESVFGADQTVFFGRAAQAEALAAELLAEPTVRGNKSFFALPPPAGLYLARSNQRASKVALSSARYS